MSLISPYDLESNTTNAPPKPAQKDSIGVSQRHVCHGMGLQTVLYIQHNVAAKVHLQQVSLVTHYLKISQYYLKIKVHRIILSKSCRFAVSVMVLEVVQHGKTEQDEQKRNPEPSSHLSSLVMI